MPRDTSGLRSTPARGSTAATSGSRRRISSGRRPPSVTMWRSRSRSKRCGLARPKVAGTGGPMNLKRAVAAGVVGTAVMTFLLWWAPLVGLPKLAIGELLSTFLAVSVAVLRVGPTGGWVIHGIVGVGLAILYAVVFAKLLPGKPVVRGALYGFLVFLVAQLVF